MAEKLKTTITTPEFRVSYPKVFKPDMNKLSKKLEYSVEALFPKGADMKPMQAIAEAACVNKFGADKTKWPKNIRNPFRDQAEKEKEGKLADGLVKGAVFMRFKCDGEKHRPAIVGRKLEPITEEHQFYAGCWAKASVGAFAYNQAGNAGVSFGLNSLQFVKDDTPFSGRPSIEDAFEAIEEDGNVDEGAGAASVFGSLT